MQNQKRQKKNMFIQKKLYVFADGIVKAES